MDDTIKSINEWLAQLSEFSLPDWNALPDLDLYMDQVVTYLERELSPLMVENQEKMITTWMINNYVKGNLLPPSVSKRYTKKHIGFLLAICSIKQILSISDIANLFKFQEEYEIEAKKLYAFFRRVQAGKLNGIAQETLHKFELFLSLNKSNNNDNDDKEYRKAKLFLYEMIFKLAIEGEVKKIIANKILYLLTKSDELKKDKQDQERIDKNKKVKSNKNEE